MSATTSFESLVKQHYPKAMTEATFRGKVRDCGRHSAHRPSFKTGRSRQGNLKMPTSQNRWRKEVSGSSSCLG